MARDIEGMMRDMDSLFDSVFTLKGASPAVDVTRSEGEYRVMLDVAGMTADELSAYIEDHVLHVKGERKCKDEEGRRYLVRERRCSSFERLFTLPEDAQEESLSASLADGVLTLTLPRKGKSGPRRIEVGINREEK